MGFTVDGTDIKGVTVDGNTIREIIVDGTTVWTAEQAEMLISTKVLDSNTGNVKRDISTELDPGSGSPYLAAADNVYYFRGSDQSEIKVLDAKDPNNVLATISRELGPFWTTDASGNLLARYLDSSTRDKYIDKYDATGTLVWSAQVDDARGLACSYDDYCYVYTIYHDIVELDSSGAQTNSVTTNISGTLERIAVTKDKEVFFSYDDGGSGEMRLAKFDSSLSKVFDVLFASGLGQADQPALDSTDAGNAVSFVIDDNNDYAKVFVLDGSDGSEITNMDLSVYDSSKSGTPLDMYVDPEENIVVALEQDGALYLYSYSITDNYAANFTALNATADYNAHTELFCSRYGERGRSIEP